MHFFFPSFFLAESSCRSFCLSVSPSLSVQASNELFRDCGEEFDHQDKNFLRLVTFSLKIVSIEMLLLGIG